MFTKSISEYIHEHGGRVLILFLLFLLAIYNLYSAGITGFALICCIPLIPVIIFFGFHHKMIMFWILFLINYFIMGSLLYINLPCPVSLPAELLELTLLFAILIDNKNIKIHNIGSVMLFALLMWFFLAIIEMFNDTCNLGFNITAWFVEIRLSVFQLIYIYCIFSFLISDYNRIIRFLYVWAALSIFAAIWAWKQRTIGFTAAEKSWLYGYAFRTHIVNGIIRYFSFFSDAANFGCNMASSAITFIILGITSHLKRDKILFLLAGSLCIYGMFTSGTRTAIFCLLLGGFLYVFLSKSIKIALPVSLIGTVFFILLAFTTIGNGNSMIRRMRTAFDKNDASGNVREINKKSMAKYLKDAPWGMGIGMRTDKVPANNKYKILSNTPPDSTYVYVWIHTGIIGVTIYTIMNVLMLLGGCQIVLFKLSNKVLRGIGASLCCGFLAINLGSYGNQIMPQYPNTFIFYGGMAIVYLLPKIEPQYIKFEEEDNIRIAEEKKIKAEKKKNPFYDV